MNNTNSFGDNDRGRRLLKRFRLPHHKAGEKFLKGPIPWEWICIAARLGGKSLHVSLELWHAAFITRSACVRLSMRKLECLGVLRHAAYRALRNLQKAGLIEVQRHVGRLPVVTILTGAEGNTNEMEQGDRV
jgi:hypothetical protein